LYEVDALEEIRVKQSRKDEMFIGYVNSSPIFSVNHKKYSDTIKEIKTN
jgi:hypothetical protein